MAAPHIPAELIEAKRLARQRMLAAREAWDPGCGRALGEHVLREAPPPAGAVVSGFWPMGQEIDIRPLLLELHESASDRAARNTKARQPIDLSTLASRAVMVPERFGTSRPDGDVRVPDFLLVPLLAFDRRGYRVGYGAGYYDRTLASLPGRFRLGVAYAAQELDEVPAGPYDERLDAVATERGVIFCKE